VSHDQNERHIVIVEATRAECAQTIDIHDFIPLEIYVQKSDTVGPLGPSPKLRK